MNFVAVSCITWLYFVDFWVLETQTRMVINVESYGKVLCSWRPKACQAGVPKERDCKDAPVPLVIPYQSSRQKQLVDNQQNVGRDLVWAPGQEAGVLCDITVDCAQSIMPALKWISFWPSTQKGNEKCLCLLWRLHIPDGLLQRRSNILCQIDLAEIEKCRNPLHWDHWDHDCLLGSAEGRVSLFALEALVPCGTSSGRPLGINGTSNSERLSGKPRLVTW